MLRFLRFLNSFHLEQLWFSPKDMVSIFLNNVFSIETHRPCAIVNLYVWSYQYIWGAQWNTECYYILKMSHHNSISWRAERFWMTILLHRRCSNTLYHSCILNRRTYAGLGYNCRQYCIGNLSSDDQIDIIFNRIISFLATTMDPIPFSVAFLSPLQ